ncbi:hypothetical protein LCGC14_2709010, partial [marine sediment metagenome]
GGDPYAGEPVVQSMSLNFDISIVPYFWIPADTMRQHIKTDRVPYDQWEKRGLLTATEGNVIDYDRILKDITGPIVEQFPLLAGAEIGYDPAFATDLAVKLQNYGFTMVEIPQNYRHFSEPCHIMEAMIKGGRVHHSGHRVLRWNVENVAVKRDDAGRLRPVKPRRTAKRIDGLVAALMGLARAMVAPLETDTGVDFL